MILLDTNVILEPAPGAGPRWRRVGTGDASCSVLHARVCEAEFWPALP